MGSVCFAVRYPNELVTLEVCSHPTITIREFIPFLISLSMASLARQIRPIGHFLEHTGEKIHTVA